MTTVRCIVSILRMALVNATPSMPGMVQSVRISRMDGSASRMPSAWGPSPASYT